MPPIFRNIDRTFAFSHRLLIGIAASLIALGAHGQSECKAKSDTGTYEGECRDGWAEGHGTLSFPDGIKVEGEWRNGNMNGKGSLTTKDGYQYTGDWLDGKKHGQGTETWADGTKYVGSIANGKRNGSGIYTWSDGGRYEGDFVDGVRTGKGIYYWPNGNKYEGDFVDNARTGKGILTSPKGDRYEGEWQNGKNHGKGIRIWANGNRYEGDFVDGVRTGKGTFSWTNGDRYVGDFVDDRRQGKGVYTWPNGTRYEGEVNNNKLEGKGIKIWADGSRYDGHWADDKRQGYGETRFKNGEIQRGAWLADKLERACKSDAACADMKEEYSTPLANCRVIDAAIAREYRGECRNGLAHGKGRAKGKDAYVGEFQDGNAHGQGTYTWASGDSFAGQWQDGKKTYGKYTWSSGNYYEGYFVNNNFNGYGVKTRNCNCGFWSCDTCTDRGWWQDDKFVRSCDSKDACEKLIRLEPLIRKAESDLRCEEAKKLNQELETVKSGIFSFDSCLSERKFNAYLKSSDPQAMYLAAGRYESDGERSRAKTIYRRIVERFSRDQLAVKATDRLTRLSDVESVESSNRNAAYQVENAHNQSREASYQQCMNNYNACLSRCNHKSSCTSGCSLCTK